MSKALLIAAVALMTVAVGREVSKSVSKPFAKVTSTMETAVKLDTDKEWIEKSRKGF